MGKQQPNFEAPYKTYTIEEFQRLARLGVWSGGNVIEIGFVYRGRSIPKYIQVFISSRRENQFFKKVGDAALYTGIVAGFTERSTIGSLRLLKGGQINPAYYKYLERTGKGWTGGSPAQIETIQLSSKELRYAGKFVGNIATYAGLAISGYTGYQALRAKDYRAFNKSGLDMTFGVIGFFGTPGFIVSSLYFLIDPLGDHSSSEIKLNEQNPIDNLKVNKKIMTLQEQEQMRIRQLNKIEQPIIKRGF